MYSSQLTEHFLLWYRRSFTLLRRSSVIRPDHPALLMALSIASILFQPCSGITSGRYVAVKDGLDVTLGKYAEDESGDGVSDELSARRDG